MTLKLNLFYKKIDNERIDGRTGDTSRHDTQAWWVWLQGKNAFSDIRLTNVDANSQKQKNQTVETILKKDEKEKKGV